METKSCSPCLKIVKVEGSDNECCTFELSNEDHTLGNALRYTICKNPRVKFCGYSMPHPNERRVLIQIQVYPGKGSAADALQKGIEDLKKLSQAVKSTFLAETDKL